MVMSLAIKVLASLLSSSPKLVNEVKIDLHNEDIGPVLLELHGALEGDDHADEKSGNADDGEGGDSRFFYEIGNFFESEGKMQEVSQEGRVGSPDEIEKEKHAFNTIIKMASDVFKEGYERMPGSGFWKCFGLFVFLDELKHLEELVVGSNTAHYDVPLSNSLFPEGLSFFHEKKHSCRVNQGDS